MKNITMPLKLISLLADGMFHSSEKFSTILKTSINDINNHIKTIRNWGVTILNTPGKGYRLYTPLQLLDENLIRALLPDSRLSVLPIINSTNQYLIERIGITKPGDACVAEYQLEGRGRRGRQWISPFGNDLCLSLYWHFRHSHATESNLSLMVSIVILELLKRFGAKNGRVKWPNDLYLNDRKLAGILVEISSRSRNITHVVIGTGINLMTRNNIVNNGTFAKKWINLQEAGININRNKFVAELISTLRQALIQFEYDGFSPFFARWQELDIFFNRSVKLIIGKQEIKGIARGIDKRGALLLEQKGKLHAYFCGEISLRS